MLPRGARIQESIVKLTMQAEETDEDCSPAERGSRKNKFKSTMQAECFHADLNRSAFH